MSAGKMADVEGALAVPAEGVSAGAEANGEAIAQVDGVKVRS